MVPRFIFAVLILSVMYLKCTTCFVFRSTENGRIMGIMKTSRVNPSVKYFSFQGIPYGEPPIGELRFQDPQPVRNWQSVKFALKENNICVQMSNFGLVGDVIGNEDCLYLNVYIPYSVNLKCLKNETLLPVMVWIHGGNYIAGSGNSDTFGPDYFMEKPVLIVTINYRLNVFGFLSSKDKRVPGNAGLKDQVLALKWVQSNIKNFQGDPNRVTIFGQSAGSVSAEYHMLSSLSKGLFQQAIGESGSALDSWALSLNPLERTNRLAKSFGINQAFNQVDILQQVNYQDLIRASFNQSIVGFYLPFGAPPFTVVIEEPGSGSFLSESAYSLWTTGRYHRVPHLVGYNTEEGSIAYEAVAINIFNISVFEDSPELLIPTSLNAPFQVSVLEEILSYYFKNGSVTDIVNWINYMNQNVIVRGVEKVISLIYKDNLTYVYKFSYVGSTTNGYVGGVGHSGELQYLWYTQNNGTRTYSDDLTMKRLVTLWTNFARTGNPTPTKDELLNYAIWSKGGEVPLVLNIGDELQMGELGLVNDLTLTDFEFWTKMFEIYGNPPFLTY